MKKFISLMTLLCLCVVNASATVFTYPGELVQELTWEDVKDGNTAFVLVSGDKVLYVPTGHDTRFEDVSAISDASNAAYFKVETLDNGYLFHAYNLAGESFELNYDWYKGPGYLNCQPAIGNITFTLAGTNDKHGQDFENGAVWTVTPVEGGYTIQNVGNNGYLAGTVTSQEATHIWKFYTYKKGESFEIANKEMEAGDYCIRHAATGKFLGGANSWGTRASLVNHGQIFTVVALENGKYKLDSHTYNSPNQHFLGGDYVDNAGNEFEFIEAENGVKIVNGTNFVNAADGLVNTSVAILPKDADVWQFVTYDEMIAALADATEEAPMDATFAIKAANFSRNHYSADYETYPWIVENCTNKNLSGGINENKCAESHHSTFNIYQTLKNMPYGVYALKAQGFYRIDGGGSNVPVFYANAETMAFPLKTGTENSMDDASKSFSAGQYTIEPIYVLVENGELTIGVKNETETNLWCIWDNFELSYLGEKADYEALVMPKFLDQVKALLEEIKTLNEEYAETPMEYSAKYYLTYYSNDENKPRLETLSQVKESITMLTEIIAKAKSSVHTYANARRLAEVYYGYANYANASIEIDDFMADYEAGTLPEDYATDLTNRYYGALDALKVGTKNVTATYIQNAGLDEDGKYLKLEGWTFQALHESLQESLHGAGNKNFDMMSGSNFVELWQWSATGLPDAEMTQNITLPAGKYILTAEAQNLQQVDSSVEPGGFFLFGPEGQTEITNVAATVATTFTLTEESEVTIGVKLLGCTGNWVCVDNFQLFQVIEPTALDFVITPEEGVVESLQTITITPGVDFTVADDANIAVYCGRQQVGGWNAEAIRNNTADGVITLTFPMETKTPGVYTLDIPEGTFLWGEGEYNATYQKRLWEIAETPMAAPTFTTDETGAHLVFAENVALLDQENPVLSVQQNGVEVAQVACFYNEDYSVIDLRFSAELPAGDYTIVVRENFFGANDRPGVALAATEILFTVDVPTAISEVAANGMKDGKFVKNNRIVIVRNGKAYNAAGARIRK